MEHREDEEDAEQAFLHRSFVQEAEVLDALVTSIVQAKGHADHAIFRKAQSIVFISLSLSLSPSFAYTLFLSSNSFCARSRNLGDERGFVNLSCCV